MPIVKLAPPARQQFEDSNGVPYVGAKLFTYLAGSTTKQATYKTSVGDTANTNPIILDSAGRTPSGLWLVAGVNYKFVLAPSTDTDPPTSPIFTEDVITGINDPAAFADMSQWLASGTTPTYVSATEFTVTGDQRAAFHVGRRLRLTVTAGTLYGEISVSDYTTLTTVTVVLDSGELDSGLSAVDVGIITATSSSIGNTLAAFDKIATGADKLAYSTGKDTFAETAFTPFARTLLDDADAATARETLGVESKRLLQNLNVTTGELATGTTLIPQDDTIPQITEGDQYMTLAITPTSTTSLLEVTVTWFGSHSVLSGIAVALFRDAVADALAVTQAYNEAAHRDVQTFSYRMTSGTTSEIIFRVRAGGGDAGTTTFNGNGGGRRYGGKAASSITIKEYAA